MGKKESDARDMPIGLMMSLAMHQEAMRQFSLLDDAHQKEVIRFVEGSRTGEDAQSRITAAVNGLEQGNTGFLS